MTEQITECKQVTDEKNLKATTAPKWLLCPETDDNVIYPHRENIEITPLINGKEAFGALEQAIKNATDSIDIICWGFDPSLRLLGPKGEERYGELLERMAEKVQIRVLIWYGFIGDISADKNLPDYKRIIHTTCQSKIDRKILSAHESLTKAQREYQAAVDSWRASDIDSIHTSGRRLKTKSWKLNQLRQNMEKKQAEFEELYDQAYKHARGTPGLQYDDLVFNIRWYHRAKAGRIKGLSFTTRDVKNFIAVSDMTAKSDMDSDGVMQSLAGHIIATHHQKMVLVDYAKPEKAVGFVMGHNMLKPYYDDDQHAFNSDVRYPGFRPWQDISTRVRGAVLQDLNDNFSKAWDKEIPYDYWRNSSSRIGRSRENVTTKQLSAAVKFDSGFRCPLAQICRTEYTVVDLSILRAYERALGNTTDFVYSENQYFRYTPFAKQLRKHSETRKNCNTTDDLYWFVVTNHPNDNGQAPLTFAMLSILGQAEKLPKLARDERQKLVELRKQKQRLEKNRLVGRQRSIWLRVKKEIADLEDHYVKVDEQGNTVAASSTDLQKKNQQETKDVLDVDDPTVAFELYHTTGLKVHIATLTSCTGAPSNNLYTQIYVHSKLLVVDDDYFLLGSANINKRSMEEDTELVIATPTPALASHCRNRLWQMHTKSVKADSLGNYDYWDELMNDNWRAMNRGESLVGTLTHFYDTEAARIPVLGATD